MDGSLNGRLLVALPLLEDPNFERAVVFVLDHDEDGALGVVLNRASEVSLHEALAEWSELAAQPAVMFGGGPVEPTAVVALGRDVPGMVTESADQAAGATTPDAQAVRLVDVSAGPPAGHLEQVRVFAGYAGWAPGQLEAEIEQGAWISVPARPEDVFTQDPDGLWSRVLARQPGRLRLLAGFPEDPTTN